VEFDIKKIHENKFVQSIVCEVNEYVLVFVTEKFSVLPATYIYIKLLNPSGSFRYQHVEHILIRRAAHRMYLCVFRYLRINSDFCLIQY